MSEDAPPARAPGFAARLAARLSRAWPHARAGLIGLAILLGVIDGCPIPPGNRTDLMANGRGGFETGVRMLGWIGIDVGLDELVDDVAAFARGLARTQARVLAPFMPVARTFRISQRYRLFPAGEWHPMRMVIDGRQTDGKWRILYRPLDAGRRFVAADALEYRRMRGAWDPSTRGPREGYDAVVAWLAERAFAADHDLVEVRVRMEVLTVAPRLAGVTATGRFLHERRRLRAPAAPRP